MPGEETFYLCGKARFLPGILPYCNFLLGCQEQPRSTMSTAFRLKQFSSAVLLFSRSIFSRMQRVKSEKKDRSIFSHRIPATTRWHRIGIGILFHGPYLACRSWLRRRRLLFTGGSFPSMGSEPGHPIPVGGSPLKGRGENAEPALRGF